MKIGYLIPILVICAFVLARRYGSRRYSSKKKEEGLKVLLRQTDIIKEKVIALLERGKAGTCGGFIIFSGESDLSYVQYALEANGLMLNWPVSHKNKRAKLPSYKSVLNREGFKERKRDKSILSPAGEINKLNYGEYAMFPDALYAQAGQDADFITSHTINLLKNVFGLRDSSIITITLELKG
jgi:hypothetical protein